MYTPLWFPRWLSVKELAYQADDMGSTSGSGRSPGEEMAVHCSILAWEIPWTEEPGILGVTNTWGRKESDTI